MPKTYEINAYYSCDFETANNEVLNANETYVWLACSYNIMTEEVEYVGGNIEDFFNDFLFKHPNSYFYFHNLAFDGTFILDYLIKNGFQPLNYIDDYKDHSFKACIDNMGKYYYIEIVLRDKKKNKRKHYTIYDSYKLVPFSEETIAKSFKMDTLKGSIDYTKERLQGYQATEEEIEYIKNDTKINGKAIRYFLDNDLLHGFTIGQCAFKEWTKTQPKWRDLCPLLNREIDEFCRKSYKGGWCYANPKYTSKIIGEGVVYDANSLYPSQMLLKPMPFGTPIYFKGYPSTDLLKTHPLFIIHIITEFTLKQDHLPTIQAKGNILYGEHEYLEMTYEPLDLWLTNVDLELMFKQYDILYLEYVDGYAFMETTKLFTEYVTKFMNMKIENDKDPGMRQLAKLFLNNLYGQMVKRPLRQAKIPVINEDGVLDYVKSSPYYIESNYTPIGSFITSYGRNETISKAQANYDRFLYADTDSVHLIGTEEPKNIQVDDTKFGYWKKELTFQTAKYLRAKTYMEIAEDKKVVRIAGLPHQISDKITIEEFKLGAEFEGKLIPRHVKGGTILTSTTYKIKE